ncbi:YqgQ family protein [Salinicoccus sp. Marseille-QA3877]
MKLNKDLTYINDILLRFGSYVYDKDMNNRLELMKMEIQELYRNKLIGKEEYLNSLLIINKRMSEEE